MIFIGIFDGIWNIMEPTSHHGCSKALLVDRCWGVLQVYRGRLMAVVLHSETGHMFDRSFFPVLDYPLVNIQKTMERCTIFNG